MTTMKTTHSVRYAFAMLLLALTLFTLIESALGANRTGASVAAGKQLIACGSEAQPCVLEAVTVEAEPLRNARLVSTEHPARMAVRVGS